MGLYHFSNIPRLTVCLAFSWLTLSGGVSTFTRADTVSERVPCVSSIMANQVLGEIIVCINLLVRFYGVTIHTNETSLKDLLKSTI